jgi:hydroxyethylthiazole kinase-like uncharacterized protein yjeF
VNRVLPITRDWPLFDAERTRAIEQQAARTRPPHTLMSRAGTAVARLALALAPHARHIWIAAGPGNNGGDGYEAAVHLRAWGKDVEVSSHGDPARLPADAAAARARAQAAGVRIVEAAAAAGPSQRPQLAIDALLGAGANRAPEGLLGSTLSRLNAMDCPILAVDLPSGLNTDTGQPLGEACVVATHTLALLTVKPGLCTGSGRDHAGVIWFDDLGVDVSRASPCAVLRGRAPRAARRHDQHKGSFGDVAIVGGSAGMVGAALLAARAAHAAGAGRVYVEVLDPSPNASSTDPQRPELMFRRGWWAAAAGLLARATVVCGCGGGDAIRLPLPRLLSRAGRLVLDADALNALATDAQLRNLLQARTSRGLATILTPHPLEAARLLDCSARQVQADRLHAARAIAEALACIVVLKGSGSVIAAPGRVPCINATGNGALATAGTGDVLAGWLGGRWSPLARSDSEGATAFEVACQAVAEHGAAAEPEPAGPLRAGDLIERLVAVD